jgi:hypothetical protein
VREEVKDLVARLFKSVLLSEREYDALSPPSMLVIPAACRFFEEAGP